MNAKQLKQILGDVKSGKLSIDDAIERFKHLPFEDLGFARVDHHRTLRQGFPEVVLGSGKTPEQITGIVHELLHNQETSNILITRCQKADVYGRIKSLAPAAEFHESASAITIVRDTTIYGAGTVLVVTGGTSDIPVAEEAVVTARVMGNEVEAIYDVGVAGIHRLVQEIGRLSRARVIIVAAGMEGALASVVGGMVSAPVIAVPTSVGYGASFKGLAALLTMLNSCASNVAVVNIDNGFGAGYVASLINRRKD
jgi:NCAIR mutase (PurE)-related protein